MKRPILIVRPQPGADATAARAAKLGLGTVVAPLFRITPRSWTMPADPPEALLVTSANGARHLDERVSRDLPVYAVGSATAAALADAGFANVISGREGVEQVVAMAEAAGIENLLHLAGEDRTPFVTDRLRIETRTVYAATACDPSPAFHDALEQGAVILLHSARAAQRFRALAGTGHRVAAISHAVLAAAGAGWTSAVAADRPTDDALLAAAARLCQG